VPSSLQAAVSAVVGLDDSPRLQAPDNRRDAAPNQSHGAPGVGFRAGRPCSTSFGEKNVTTSFTAYGTKSKPLAPCGYTPAQVRGLYGLTDPTGGTGQTVAFVGANASPTLARDVTQYSRLHSLPDPSITQLVAPGIYRHPDTVRQVPGDFYGEETLDAEAIHSTAPGAHLLYVASSNANQDFDASINHIVDKRLAPIISISYGFNGEAVPRGFITSLNNTFLQAVATGIGVYVSSGDNGDDASSTGTTAVDFYADSPNVTAVGGTSAAIVPGAATGTGTKASGAPAARSSKAAPDTYGVDNPASPLNQPGWARSFEVGWQTGFSPVSNPVLTSSGTAFALTGTLRNGTPGSFFGGAGGGVSKVFPQPGYQQGVTDAVTDGSTGATGRTGRAVPDISAVGDPNTGFLVGQTQAFSDGTYYDEYRIGGTSVSAPLMAGMARSPTSGPAPRLACSTPGSTTPTAPRRRRPSTTWTRGTWSRPAPSPRRSASTTRTARAPRTASASRCAPWRSPTRACTRSRATTPQPVSALRPVTDSSWPSTASSTADDHQFVRRPVGPCARPAFRRSRSSRWRFAVRVDGRGGPTPGRCPGPIPTLNPSGAAQGAGLRGPSGPRAFGDVPRHAISPVGRQRWAPARSAAAASPRTTSTAVATPPTVSVVR